MERAEAAGTMPRRWIEGSRQRPEAQARLIALPYAGGSSAIYRAWNARLPDAIELLAVQLPGRGGRFRDALPETLLGLVDEMAEGLTPFLDKPYAVFGHSMGALLGFELCRALRARGAPLPRALIVAGSPGPRYRAERRTTAHQLPDDEFARLLETLNATPPEVLANAEFMRIALPMLRSDFRICETYDYRPADPLPVPIVAVGGEDDRLARPELLDEWRQETSAGLRVRRLPGGHFFVNTARDEVIDLVVAEAFADLHGRAPT